MGTRVNPLEVAGCRKEQVHAFRKVLGSGRNRRRSVQGTGRSKRRRKTRLDFLGPIWSRTEAVPVLRFGDLAVSVGRGPPLGLPFPSAPRREGGVFSAGA